MIEQILVELNRVERFLFDSTCRTSNTSSNSYHRLRFIAAILSDDHVEIISRCQIIGLDNTLFILLNQFTLLRNESVQRVRAARNAAEKLRLREADEELNENPDEQEGTQRYKGKPVPS